MVDIAKRRSYWEKWSQDHRELLKYTREMSGLSKHLARVSRKSTPLKHTSKIYLLAALGNLARGEGCEEHENESHKSDN